MFSDKDKIATFDKIYKLYFNQNFGSLTKADLELLLFSDYLDNRILSEEPYDDYSLSRELGITQSKIRSLKERKELKYSYVKNNWQKAFAASIKNAKYDETDHHVKLFVEDVNVLNEIRHLVEEKGWYDECSLNRKLLNIPLGCFVEICVDNESLAELFSPEVKKRVKKLSHKDIAISNFISDFSKDGLKWFLMSASKHAIIEVLKLLPFGGIAKVAFDFIGQIIGG